MTGFIFTREIAVRLVETLGHSLWQGAAAALLLFVVLRILPARAAGARYASCLVALGAMVLACVVTWNLLAPRGTPMAAVTAVVHGGGEAVVAPVGAVTDKPPMVMPATTVAAGGVQSSAPIDWRASVLIAWSVGVGVGLARLILAVAGVRRLRLRSQPPDDPWLAERLAEIAARLQVRQRVRVLLNPQLIVPAVCGLFRPVILVPTSMVTGVPAAYLEAALAHELAHIRRQDYLVNLVQMAVEALLFFNPCVWWVSRQIRIEREACCDALAMRVVGEPGAYARALAAVAEVALHASHGGGLVAAPAMAMAGEPRDQGQLSERVRRILRPTDRPGLRLSWPSTVAFLAVSLLVLAVLRFTTNAAIAILTPQQRIEKVAELQKRYPVHAVESAEQQNKSGTAREPRQTITLAGRIESEDGSTLPEHVSLSTYVSRPGWGSTASQRVDKNGEFKLKIESGNIALLVQAEGWAPKHLRLGKISESQENLMLKLEKGFSSSLLFLTADKKPLAGVEVKIWTQGSPGSRIITVKSGTDGVARFEHLAAEDLAIAATLPAYQQATWEKIVLLPNGTRELTMEPSVMTSGSVADGATGAPMEGAEIKLYKEYRQRAGMNHGDSGPVVARSGRDGKFTLDTLRDDTEYHFLISAPGYLGQMLRIVKSGEQPQVRLAPGHNVRLEVRGITPKQLNRNGELDLQYNYTVIIRSNHYSEQSDGTRSFTGKVKDGVAVFEVPLVLESETSFVVGSRRFEFTKAQITDRRETFVLDLQAPEANPDPAADPAILRAVEIRIETPKDSPRAAGKLIVHYIKNTTSARGVRIGGSKVVEVLDGVARVEIPAPNELSFGVEGVQGYWFRDPLRVNVPLGPKDEVVKHSIEAQPAGAIYGHLSDAAGNPAQGALFSVCTLPGHKVLQGNPVNLDVKSSSSSEDDSSRFMASPLPLGGKFMITASQGNFRVFTEPLTIDEKTPFHDIRLQFPAGETIQGRLIAPDGGPMRNVEVMLCLKTGIMEASFKNTGAITDRNGEFRIEGVNARVPGKYYVEVEKLNGAQPARLDAVFGKPMEIRLKQGLTLSGVVKEARTSRVIPGAEVYARVADFTAGTWPDWIDASARTDQQGRFHFDQLPPGVYRISSRSGQVVDDPVVTAGQKQEISLELKLYSGSELQPVEP